MSGRIVSFKIRSKLAPPKSIKLVHAGFEVTLDHVGVTTRSFVNPDKLMDDCKVVIRDGFESTWDHVRSLLNPDRLMEDCAVVIHDGLDCTSAHVRSL